MRDARRALGEDGDTIAAAASARGPGALAVIRISGPKAFAATVELGVRIAAESPGWGVRPARVALTKGGPSLPARVCTMPGPRSYTGEDQVELHLPGGEGVTSLILEALGRAGVRLAGPGEFTRRAYRHGKMDLAQAEGVAALVSAENENERRSALALLREGAGDATRGLIESIVELLVPLELDLDFSDQDIDIVVPASLGTSLDDLVSRAEALAAAKPSAARTGLQPRVLLLGPPNAGKSSLFNRLTGRDLALVSDRAGTTRDYLEAMVDCAGIEVILVDTAGAGFRGGLADEAAHRLRERELGRADLILDVADPAATDSDPAPEFRATEASSVARLRVWSRADLGSAPQAEGIAISSRDGRGLDDLRRAIAAELRGRRGTSAAALADHARRRAETYAEVAEALKRAREALRNDLGLELVAEDLQEARRGLRGLTGEEYDEAVLDRIMARFCIGK